MARIPLDDLLETIRSRYADWEWFTDATFVKDEIAYKRKASSVAGARLGKAELQALLAAGDHAEIHARLLEVGKATNLLYLSTPRTSDLRVLTDEHLVPLEHARELFDLLHGDGPSPERLARYVAYCERAGLPAQWTFTTYFLFLLHPETELFVKPQVTTRFLQHFKLDRKVGGRPDSTTYGFLLDLAKELLEQLRERGARDMIDIQSLIWVCGTVISKPRYWKVSPGEGASQWEECRREGFIGVGWDEIGDVSGMTREEYFTRSAELEKQHEPWTVSGSSALWRWFNDVKERDLIVANDGTHTILGVGTVTGPHYHAAGTRYSHRVPVEWKATEPIAVEEGGWRQTLIELSEEKFRALTEGSDQAKPASRGPYFSPRTFELLRGLRETPERDYYMKRKEEFQQHLEAPFKVLMKDLAGRLPDSLRKHLEVEKNLVSRIPKNDWGQGGAWPHYWGAFYPKGGKRIAGAQLFVFIDHSGLRYGFSFGEHAGDERERFLALLKDRGSALSGVFARAVKRGVRIKRPDASVGEGRPAPASVTEWLGGSDGADVSDLFLQLSPEQATQRSREQTADDIATLFSELFPLMLVAMRRDPFEDAHVLDSDDEKGDDDPHPQYPLEKMSAETGFPIEQLRRWVDAIERKKQIVFYGPPGTGKTYLAEKLRDHLMGESRGITELVQFHPAYAYEDFIQGIRPRVSSSGTLSYEMVPGRFLELCRRASARQGKSVLIIDELNRANLARVFGELMYLLEYRNREVPLAGGGSLAIPESLLIIGTMNTADRSIALVDHALRRRFAFINLAPSLEVLRRVQRDSDIPIDELINVLREVNQQIADPHYELGISFFLAQDLERHLPDIWRMEIEPYLEEYFFGQKGKVDPFRWSKLEPRLMP